MDTVLKEKNSKQTIIEWIENYMKQEFIAKFEHNYIKYYEKDTLRF